MRVRPALHDQAPALQRLARLAPLGDEAVALIRSALTRAMPVAAKRDLLSEGKSIREPLLLVSGWAARVRQFADGRRQFLSFLFPGDLIGMCRHPEPIAVSTIIALTAASVCPAPLDERLLGRAYSVSHAVEEAYLLDHIARLGRLNAQERIISLLLEIYERLTLNGLANDGVIDIPLTQETLGDALGLTSVHINRMIQELRRAGDLEWQGGQVRLRDPVALATRIDRTAVRVTAGDPWGAIG